MLTPLLEKESPANKISINYNSTSPVTVTASPFTTTGESYEWTLPCGWTGPGDASGTFTTSSRSIQVTPNGYTGPGEKVKVRALLTCDVSPTYTLPIEWTIAWNSSSSPTILGNDAACLAGTNYSIPVPAGQAVTWTVDPNKISFVGSSTANPVMLKPKIKTTSGTSTIIASIESSSCPTVQFATKNVWLGKPAGVTTNPSGVPAIDASVGNWVNIQATSMPGAIASSLNWWTNNSSALDLNVGYSNCSVECIQIGYNYVYVTSSNSCGTSPSRQIPFDVTSGGGGGMFMIAGPNPVGNELDIEFSINESSEILAYEEFESPVDYVLTDSYGTVLLTNQTKKTKHTLNLTSIRKSGVYILSAYNIDGSLLEQVRLLLER